MRIERPKRSTIKLLDKEQGYALAQIRGAVFLLEIYEHEKDKEEPFTQFAEWKAVA